MSFIRRLAVGIGLTTMMLATASVFAPATEATNSVTICHRTGNGSITISVAPQAVLAHILLHGDTLGPCAPTPTPTPSPTPEPEPTPSTTPEVPEVPRVEIDDPCADVKNAGTASVVKPVNYDELPVTLRDPDCGQFIIVVPLPQSPQVELAPPVNEVGPTMYWLPLPDGGFVNITEVTLPNAGDGELEPLESAEQQPVLSLFVRIVVAAIAGLATYFAVLTGLTYIAQHRRK